jgi:hypothetical protein
LRISLENLGRINRKILRGKYEKEIEKAAREKGENVKEKRRKME